MSFALRWGAQLDRYWWPNLSRLLCRGIVMGQRSMKFARVVGLTVAVGAAIWAWGDLRGDRGEDRNYGFGHGRARLLPAETFHWGVQPVAFSPPSGPWQRGKYQQSGYSGACFEIDYGAGGRISVSEYFPVGRRDRRSSLRTLAEEFESLGRRDFMGRISECRPPSSGHYTEEEAEISRNVNRALSRAVDHRFGGRDTQVKHALDEATQRAEWLIFRLEDVVHLVQLDPALYPEPDKVHPSEPAWTEIAGTPALRVNYTIEGESTVFHARDIYVLVNNHLFVGSYIGPKRHLGLFDAMMSTVEFPPEDPEAFAGY